MVKRYFRRIYHYCQFFSFFTFNIFHPNRHRQPHRWHYLHQGCDRFCRRHRPQCETHVSARRWRSGGVAFAFEVEVKTTTTFLSQTSFHPPIPLPFTAVTATTFRHCPHRHPSLLPPPPPPPPPLHHHRNHRTSKPSLS